LVFAFEINNNHQTPIPALPSARACCSQSGQTFPTLKGTARLCHELGDRVFVLVGGTDELAPYTEMGQVSLVLDWLAVLALTRPAPAAMCVCR
jgi:hypothetical protein